MQNSHSTRRLAVTLIAAATVLGTGLISSATTASAITASTPYGLGNPTSYPIGFLPRSVAVNDLNGDGHPDLVAAGSNGSSSNISVLLADPSGGYQSATEYDLTSPSLGQVAVADVTGDGNMDVIVPAVDGGSVVDVLPGDGTGALGAPVEYYLLGNSAPSGLAVGDLNGDGYPDLAVTVDSGTAQGYVSVLLSDGHGSFGTRVNYPVGDNPKGVAIADVNQDGNEDLVVANYTSGNVSVLDGDGSGGFASATSYSPGSGLNPYGLTVGNFNGDAYPDVAVTEYGNDEISVLLNDGTGDLGAAANYPTGAFSNTTDIAVGDFNDDGVPDLVAIDNEPHVFFGNGDGTFSTQRVLGSSTDAGLAVADLNDDNRPDLVTTTDGSAVVFVQDTIPTLITAPGISGRPTYQAVLDANTGQWTGNPNEFHYDWQRCNGKGCFDTGSYDTYSYDVQTRDVGYRLRVVVTAVNPIGASAPAYSAETAVVPKLPTNTALPTVGYLNGGTKLYVADKGTWTGHPTHFYYFWYLCDSAGSNCDYLTEALQLQTSQAMVGNRVGLLVEGSGPSGYGYVSVVTDPIVGVAPTNQTAPAITGDAVVGSTLAAAKGTWWATGPRRYQYQWQRCTDVNTCTPIAHARSASYTLTDTDLGDTVAVTVTAVNDYGSTPLTSAPTDTVQASA